MKRARLVLATLAVAFVAAVLLALPTHALASGASRSLVYDQNLIQQIGHQGDRGSSAACLGYDYSYVDSMFTGTVHNWTEYDYYGNTNESKFVGKGMQAYYTYTSGTSEQQILRTLYDAINQGRPTILSITTTWNSTHWVTIVGYTNVTDPNSLSMDNFIMLDPGCYTIVTNFASRGYKLKIDKNNIRISKRTLPTTGQDLFDEEAPVISNVQVYDVTSHGYTVSCTVTDNVGVDRVQFPTWTSANWQDDLDQDWPSNWLYTGTQSGDTWTFHVWTTEHNGEHGIYYTHIYAYDAAGNVSSYQPSDGITVPEPSHDSEAEETEVVPMYRLYNPWSGEHLYTLSDLEVDNLVALGWSDEGIAWNAPVTSNTPVYRLYNPYSGDHLYTSDEGEYSDLADVGWQQEGVSFYSDDDQGVPIYRLYNKWLTQGTHLFTTSASEYANLRSLGWSGEDVDFFGVAA